MSGSMNLISFFWAGAARVIFSVRGAENRHSSLALPYPQKGMLKVRSFITGFAALLVAGQATALAETFSAFVGANVTLVATADGNPAPTFQWRKNGVNIAGATNATLTLNAVTLLDGATYSVVATNSVGSAVSDDAVLQITSAPVVNVAPSITTQPAGQTVTAGTNVTFTTAASGTPAPTLQWQKNGVAISGATSATLTLNNVTAADAATYTLVATNIAGTATSTGAILKVNAAPVANVAPSITTQPAGQTVTAGANVTFTAAASGTPAPTLQWQKNGVAISGATSATLTLNNVTAADAATYTLVATNIAGTATSTGAVLKVNAAAAVTAPAFTTQPSSQTVAAGASVTFAASASGNPAPTYQWRKNGTAIAGATSSTYTIDAVGAADVAVYTVVASNSAGTVVSGNATLLVNSPVQSSAQPAITTQPVSQTANAGGSVTFSVVATGTPAPTYVWRRNGVTFSGWTGSSLTLNALTTSDAGTYTVVASNAAGSVTSASATLTVNTLPVFTLQPAGKTVTAGANVTLTATVSGSPTPTLQWHKNGTAIAGATAAVLQLNTVTVDSAATYTLVATNAAGSVTSSAAVLKVNVPPTITQQPANQTAAVGTKATFSVVATGSPAPTYQWRRNGAAIAGATGPSSVVQNITTTSAANYSVIVTNAGGTVVSKSAMLIVTTAGVRDDNGSDPGTTGEVIMPEPDTSTPGTGDPAPSTDDPAPVTDDPATDPLPGSVSRLVNLSVRTLAGSGGDSLTVGFVLDGSATKSLLIRGIGPTLGSFGVGGALADPTLALYSNGIMMASNDDWSRVADEAAAIATTSANLGAFSLPGDSRDAVLLSSLAGGAYTAQINSKGAPAGAAMVEFYDAAPTSNTRLVNLSVLTRVGGDAGSLTVGFVVDGNAPKKLLIRAVGPTIGAMGVSGVLADPQLALHRGPDRLQENDNWSGDANLQTVFNQVGAFGFLDAASKDAAMVVTVEPGAYSAIVSGANGTSGVALVEIYEVP
jgi:hypothetical protein